MKGATSLHADIELDLDAFTLSVDVATTAQVTGVFGPSGSGKTSFLESMAGLRPDVRGSVALGDAVWQDSALGVRLPPEERGVGYVPQGGLLFPHLSVDGNLRVGFRRARERGRDVVRLHAHAVELLELGELLPRRTGTLSAGERQRVALARAICSAPELILLDEPLAALDQPLRRRILPYLRRVREELDVGMIVVSHDPIEVQALCDDVVVLRRGEVVARGAPREVLLDPDVFPMAHRRGFENVVPCTTLRTDEWSAVVRLGSNGPELTVSLDEAGCSTGGARLVGIPARDVILAVEPPRGLSARNVLAAVVEDVRSVGSFELVRARLEGDVPAVAVEIGPAARRELALERGSKVFLVIKAMSCSLYDERPDR